MLGCSSIRQIEVELSFDCWSDDCRDDEEKVDDSETDGSDLGQSCLFVDLSKDGEVASEWGEMEEDEKTQFQGLSSCAHQPRNDKSRKLLFNHS